MISNLANRARPKTLKEIVGQEHLLPILNRMKENNQVLSMILFGPCGTGKTTIATCLMNEMNLEYRMINATSTNKKELNIIFEEAEYFPGKILIIDEVHRLNKDKQDLFLPYVESGKIILIGVTTENPYFSINPALRSRTLLLEVNKLDNQTIIDRCKMVIKLKDGLNNLYKIDDKTLNFIASRANGDLRLALNFIEMGTMLSEDKTITVETIAKNITGSAITNDKNGDGIYDLMSAFQKSIRGSDVNASLYYLGLLIKANDIVALERRLLVIAYEDIGLANPSVVQMVINAVNASKLVGYPEASIILSNVVIILALSPKSKSACTAISLVNSQIEEQAYNMPKYLKLTPVNLSDEEKYDYNGSDYWHKIQYLPNQLKDAEFYHPQDNSSYERQLKQNYQQLRKIKRENSFKYFKQKAR